MSCVSTAKLSGAGLGLRRSFLESLLASSSGLPDFVELAPENWIGLGGRYPAMLRAVTERFPLVCHGLSLSLGGPADLDRDFLRALARFLDEHQALHYSEHLSYSGDDGHLYDLLPIPFTKAAVEHVAQRIRIVQDILRRPLLIENISCYADPGGEMSELDFLREVLSRADCGLLLDVNNVFVNSVNQGYDPAAFISGLPAERIRYLHVAGHEQHGDDLLVDTHGEPVCPEVWRLLADVYQRWGAMPTLLERDFHMPPLPVLFDELAQIRRLQSRAGSAEQRHA